MRCDAAQAGLSAMGSLICSISAVFDMSTFGRSWMSFIWEERFQNVHDDAQ
jgi:hypothetical protein